METTATETASLATEAYLLVRQRILEGRLPLGEVLSRRKIAAELGISFLPVTEALLRLEFEGLIESRPRFGTRVRIPTCDDVKGHYVLREALEVKAAVIFAEMATPSERAELRRMASRVDALATQADRALYVSLHQKLHRRVAEVTGSGPLCRAIDHTHALAATWFCVMTRDRRPPEPRRRHQDLADALASGDGARAAEVMRQHVMAGMRHVLDALQPYFELRNRETRWRHRP